MKLIYNFGFLIFGLVYMPFFLIRLRQAEDGKRLLRERLGKFPKDLKEAYRQKKAIWIHAVSVGEVMASRKFIDLLLERSPNVEILLTTVTPTGQSIAKQINHARVRVCYFPFDFTFAVNSFLNIFDPQLILLAETEIWPNLILEAKLRKIPIGIINARLSPRSFKRYRKFRWLFSRLFRKLEFVLAQSREEASRFAELGVSPKHLYVFGNMKFDNVSLNSPSREQRCQMREEWGIGTEDLVLIGGSTHSGEEEILLEVFQQFRKPYPRLKLILAPRHIERTARLVSMAKKAKLNVLCASQKNIAQVQDILMLDQLGVLKELYAVADVAFVGGSLVRHGGQNPIEPASCRCPIFHGPFIFNFEKVYQILDSEMGSRLVQSKQELIDELVPLFEDEIKRMQMGDNAYNAIVKLQGASEEHVKWVQAFMDPSGSERKMNVEVDEKLFSPSS